VKDVDAGTAKAADGGKEVHNLPRGCRDYKKDTGKNNNKKKAMNTVNNLSEYREEYTCGAVDMSRDWNRVYLPHCC
jgi:hypothetical protein